MTDQISEVKCYRARFTDSENRAVRSLTTMADGEGAARRWAFTILERGEHPDQVGGRVVHFQRVELDWKP